MNKLNILKCVVRLEDNTPIIIMENKDKEKYDCFTFKDGHNEMSLEYMRKLPLANEEITKKTLMKYQNHIDSLPIEKIEIKEVKRLKR